MNATVKRFENWLGEKTVLASDYDALAAENAEMQKQGKYDEARIRELEALIVRRCKTTPLRERRRILRLAEKAEEQCKALAMRIRNALASDTEENSK